MTMTYAPTDACRMCPNARAISRYRFLNASIRRRPRPPAFRIICDGQVLQVNFINLVYISCNDSWPRGSIRCARRSHVMNFEGKFSARTLATHQGPYPMNNPTRSEGHMCQINKCESSGLLPGHGLAWGNLIIIFAKKSCVTFYSRSERRHVPVSDLVKTSTFHFRLDRSLHESVPLRVRLIRECMCRGLRQQNRPNRMITPRINWEINGARSKTPNTVVARDIWVKQEQDERNLSQQLARLPAAHNIKIELPSLANFCTCRKNAAAAGSET